MNKFSKALEKLARAKHEAQQTAGSDHPAAPEPAEQETAPLTRGLPRPSMVVNPANIAPCIVAVHQPLNRVSEQYRVLRTNVKSLKKRSIKTILVSSSIEGEGKTVTSINLAYTFAQDTAKRVLLIDADMRRSKVGYYLGLDVSRPGLRDVIDGRVAFDDALVQGNEQLHILTGNPVGSLTNAAEQLESAAMKRILDMARSTYDYVIIDAPPVIPVTDAAVLGAYVDGLLLVFQAERTPRSTVQHAQQVLEQAHVPVLGYVMTHVQYFAPGYRDYHYYKHYYN